MVDYLKILHRKQIYNSGCATLAVAKLMQLWAADLIILG